MGQADSTINFMEDEATRSVCYPQHFCYSQVALTGNLCILIFLQQIPVQYSNKNIDLLHLSIMHKP